MHMHMCMHIYTPPLPSPLTPSPAPSLAARGKYAGAHNLTCIQAAWPSPLSRITSLPQRQTHSTTPLQVFDRAGFRVCSVCVSDISRCCALSSCCRP